MKKTLLITCIALTWMACSKDSDCPEEPDNGEIKITATLATTIKADTKTTIKGDTATWKDGDAIGLFCDQPTASAPANINFTVSGVASTPSWTTSTPIYWTDGTTTHKFLAYAPYASGNTSYTAIPLPALTGQTGTIDPTKDFLYSKNQWGTNNGVARTGGPVALTFTHALSLVQFNIKVNGSGSFAAGTTLTGITLAGGASDKVYSSDATSSKIDLSTGTITAGTTTNTTAVTPGTPPTLSSSTATKLYVLILPGTFTAPTLAITIKEGSATFTVPATALSTTTFAAGSRYSYDVTISRTAIAISNPIISDWNLVSGTAINPGL